MSDFAVVIVSGILLGTLYAVMSYGMGLIYGVMKVLNLAHAGFLTLGAYLSYTLFASFRIDPFVSLLLIVPFAFLLGIMTQVLFVRRVMRGPQIATLLLLFGLWLVIKNIVYLVWGADDHTVRTAYTFSTLHIFIPLNYSKLAVFAAAFLISVCLCLFLKYTYLGQAIRAIAQEPEAASLSGINNKKVSTISFGLGTALAAMAGSLMSLIYSINPEFGGPFLLKSFCVIVLGGMGSMTGILLGGILLGFTEAVSVMFMRASLQDVISFVLLVLILIFRPSGLMGAKL